MKVFFAALHFELGTLQRLLRATSEAQGSPPKGYHATTDVDAVGLL